MGKKKGLIFTITGVVLILAAVLTIVLWPKKSAKEVYTDAIKTSLNFSKLSSNDKTIEEYKRILNDHIIKMTFQDSGVNNEEDAQYHNFDELIEAYLGKNNLYLKMDSTLDGTLSSLEYLYKDNKFYMFIKDVFSKYYYIDYAGSNDSRFMINIDYEDVANKFIDSLVDEIKDDKIVKESADVTINGKTYSTDKYSYTFTGEYLYNATKSFITKIRNDKELYNKFNDLFKSFENENGMTLDDAFDALINMSESFKALGDIFTHSAYIDDEDIISTEMILNFNFGGQGMPMTFGFTINSIMENGKQFREVFVSAMGQKLYDVVLNQTSDTNTDIKVNIVGQEMIKGNVTKSDKNIKMVLNGTELFPKELKLEANIEAKSDYEIVGNIEYINGESHATYKFATEEVQEAPEVDVSNSAPREEMTDAEKEAMDALMKRYNPNSSFIIEDETEEVNEI